MANAFETMKLYQDPLGFQILHYSKPGGVPNRVGLNQDQNYGHSRLIPTVHHWGVFGDYYRGGGTFIPLLYICTFIQYVHIFTYAEYLVLRLVCQKDLLVKLIILKIY